MGEEDARGRSDSIPLVVDPPPREDQAAEAPSFKVGPVSPVSTLRPTATGPLEWYSKLDRPQKEGVGIGALLCLAIAIWVGLVVAMHPTWQLFQAIGLVITCTVIVGALIGLVFVLTRSRRVRIISGLVVCIVSAIFVTVTFLSIKTPSGVVGATTPLAAISPSPISTYYTKKNAAHTQKRESSSPQPIKVVAKNKSIAKHVSQSVNHSLLSPKPIPSVPPVAAAILTSAQLAALIDRLSKQPVVRSPSPTATPCESGEFIRNGHPVVNCKEVIDESDAKSNLDARSSSLSPNLEPYHSSGADVGSSPDVGRGGSCISKGTALTVTLTASSNYDYNRMSFITANNGDSVATHIRMTVLSVGKVQFEKHALEPLLTPGHRPVREFDLTAHQQQPSLTLAQATFAGPQIIPELQGPAGEIFFYYVYLNQEGRAIQGETAYLFSGDNPSEIASSEGFDPSQLEARAKYLIKYDEFVKEYC